MVESYADHRVKLILAIERVGRGALRASFYGEKHASVVLHGHALVLRLAGEFRHEKVIVNRFTD